MALSYRQIPDENGALQWTVDSDQENPHLLFTGQHASGRLTTSDGTEYDVTEPYVEIQQTQHAGELSHLIGVQHEQNQFACFASEPVYGPHPLTQEPDHLIAAPHECTDDCGAFKVTQPVHCGHLGMHRDQVAQLLPSKES